jgi:hypothetical protein
VGEELTPERFRPIAFLSGTLESSVQAQNGVAKCETFRLLTFRIFKPLRRVPSEISASKSTKYAAAPVS